ncbi:MAG: hypothetical protein IJV66_00650, partial [Firmicutes bacterium]|nr:hypothetical protein [Bacillota bacterium]
DSIRTGGKKYETDEDASSSGGSVFTIPVKINENTSISARTTAMSQPHWIDYDIYVFLKEADRSGNLSGETVVSRDSLEGDVPAILGLPEGEVVDTGDAQLMRIFSFGEISLLQIDVSKNKSVLRYDEPGETLYESNVVNYLILPEDTQLPAGTDQDFILVRTPVKSTYTAEDVRQLDYKDIIQSEAEMVKLPAEQIKKFLWFGKGKREAAEELEKSLVTLGIPLFFDRADSEKGKERKAQWEKVYELFQ